MRGTIVCIDELQQVVQSGSLHDYISMVHPRLKKCLPIPGYACAEKK
jgi:hypothetical protein